MQINAEYLPIGKFTDIAQHRRVSCANGVCPRAAAVASGQGRAMTRGLCDNIVNKNAV
jgi:hypothetical protein